MGPAFSVASKPPALEPLKVPGPGTYDTDKLKNTSRSKASIVFGSAQRDPKDFSTLKIVPGPGTYREKPTLLSIGGAMYRE